MKKLNWYFWVLVLALSVFDAKAADVIDYTWESGTLASPGTCQGKCSKATQTQAKKGSWSGEFTLVRSGPTDYRTEITWGQTGQMLYDQEYWFGFDVYFPSTITWNDTGMGMNPFQIHNRDFFYAGCGLGSAVGSAPLFMAIQNGTLSIRRYQNQTMWSQANFTKDTWVNFAVRAKFSASANGFYEVYRNGTLLASFVGKTATNKDACGNTMAFVFLKEGLYYWENKDTPPKPTRTIYLDNQRIWSGPGGKEFVTGGLGGGGAGDTTPPTFSNQVATSLSPTSERITWGTSEPTPTNSVDYGLTTAYGSNKADNVTGDTHAAELTGLTANTLYHFRVRSTDAAGNAAIGTDHTFTTAAASGDTTAPTVSTATVTLITSTSATIAWTTDEPASPSVKYGPTTGYGSSSSKSTVNTAHNIKLIGLTPNTLYNFQCTSRDVAQNIGNNSNATFTTLP